MLPRVQRGLPHLGWATWAVLALALVLRVGAAEFEGSRLDLGRDAEDLHLIAASLAAGDGYPTDRIMSINGGPSAFRPPAYPYALAGLFEITGPSEQASRIFGAVMGTLCVALIGLIAWQLWRRRDVALGAMGILAVYPPLFHLSVQPMTETVFFPVMLGSIAAALAQRESESGIRWGLLAGALCGVALLSRISGFFVLIPLVLLVLNRRPLWSKRALAPGLAVGLTAMVVLAPWTIRNAYEFDAFVPVTTQTGMALAGAYNEETRVDPSHEWRTPFTVEGLSDLYQRPGFDEAELSGELVTRSRQLVLDHPLYPLSLAVDNLGRLFEVHDRLRGNHGHAELLGISRLDAPTTTFRAVFLSNWFGFWLLAVLAAIGIVRGEWRRIPLALWLVPILALIGPMFTIGGTRYRLPADFFLILVAAPVVAAFAQRALARLSGRSPA